MNFTLPISPRYVLPLLVAAVALDALCMGAAAVLLYTHAENAHIIRTGGFSCATYNTTAWDSAVYLVSRCTKDAP